MSSSAGVDIDKGQKTRIAEGKLEPGVLRTPEIVFMVMAAAAPMAVVVALMPMAFAFGNGGGVPGTYFLAILSVLLFAVGYVRIIPHVQNAGAFYAYIAASAGRAWGLAAAYVAAISYFSLSCSTVAAFSFFCAQLVHELTGASVHWSVFAAANILVVGLLSYYRISLAATVLSVALIAEVSLILMLDIAIVKDVGISGFQSRDFAPGSVFAPGLGIALIYAFNSMIGVEGTAIYQEEAVNRRVSIPRATYISVVLVGLFYVFTAWCLVSAFGSSEVSSAARNDPGTFVLRATRTHLGELGALAIGVLTIGSAFAAVLALFNNCARYLYALGRDGVLPRRLATTHPRHHSPYVAGFALTVGLAAIFMVAVAAKLNPLLNIAPALVGFGSVGLMALLGITALAIPIFFAKRKQLCFATGVAPTIGGIVIVTATILAFLNYSSLTGVESVVINRLPYLLLVIAAGGAAQAMWLRARRPGVYNSIGATRIEGGHEVAQEPIAPELRGAHQPTA